MILINIINHFIYSRLNTVALQIKIKRVFKVINLNLYLQLYYICLIYLSIHNILQLLSFKLRNKSIFIYLEEE